ncbi:DUF72 domain-containing protein [Candidatus Hydrogenedentota bacterium]
MESSSSSSCAIHIGVAGWSYPDWRGIVFTPETSHIHPLELLGSFFNAAEVNTTFYATPEPRICQHWLEPVRDFPDFKFTIKLYRGFTHEAKAWHKEDVTKFLRAIGPIAEAGKLGAVLMQFPMSFHDSDENLAKLDEITDVLRDLPLAVELRHDSWLEKKSLDFIRSKHVTLCCIDQPLFTHSIPPTYVASAKLAYVRLHGLNAAEWFREAAGRDKRYDYLYTEEQIESWVDRIRRIAKRVSELYVITNNHFRGQAVCNAIELAARIKGKKFDIPQTLRATYPRLEQYHEESGPTQLTFEGF